MAILNSFVNDIFERIATEASSKFIQPRVSYLILIAAIIRACRLLQKIDNLLSRNSNIRSSHSTRRTCQARYLRGYKVCHQGMISSLGTLHSS